MSTIITIALIVAAIAAAFLALWAWAKVHTNWRANQVWAQIERWFGPQERRSWAYAWDPSSGAPVKCSSCCSPTAQAG